MAEAPALPLWTDAYLADTGHLTTLEHGAYLLLLMTMWRNGGSLPQDDVRLARFARLTMGQWRRIRPTILEFFRSENGQLYQNRLTDELAFVRQKSTSQQNNARAKHRKTKKTGGAMGGDWQCQTAAPTPKDIPVTSVTGQKPKNARDRLFAEGKQSLQRMTGKRMDQCGPIIGKLLKAANDDAAALLSKILQAEADQIADPVGWLVKSFGASGQKAGSAASQTLSNFIEVVNEDRANGERESEAPGNAHDRLSFGG